MSGIRMNFDDENLMSAYAYIIKKYVQNCHYVAGVAKNKNPSVRISMEG